jgi:hypothetical protein
LPDHHPSAAQGSHWRQAGETVAEALHPAPFVIDGNQQWRLSAGRGWRRQGRQLRWIGVVARKQDDAADQRMAEALTVEIGQFGAGDVDHQRAERQVRHACSRMT